MNDTQHNGHVSRRRLLSGAAAIAVGGSTGVLGTITPGTAVAKEDIEEEIEKLEQQIENEKAAIGALETEIEQLREQLDKIDEDTSNLEGRIDRLEKELQTAGKLPEHNQSPDDEVNLLEEQLIGFAQEYEGYDPGLVNDVNRRGDFRDEIPGGRITSAEYVDDGDTLKQVLHKLDDENEYKSELLLLPIGVFDLERFKQASYDTIKTEVRAASDDSHIDTHSIPAQHLTAFYDDSDSNQWITRLEKSLED